MKKFTLYIVFISVALLNLANCLIGQEIFRGNPADRDDPKTLLRNPAILPFQNLAVNFGMRILNYGFLEDDPAGLKFIYNTTSYPDLMGTGIAVGVTAISFNSPLYTQSEFGLATAYSIGDAVALGIHTRFRNHGFNEANMDLVNPNDPIFANGNSQWNVSFDAGLLVSPMEDLSIGASISNLNEPDLSFQNRGAKLPMEVAFGGKYYFRNFGFSLFGNYYMEKISLGLLAEANLNNRFVFRTGYLGVDKSFMTEARMYVAKGFGLCYRFDYPLNEMSMFNSGTHQLELSWNMRYNPLYAYDIAVSTDTVYIFQELPVLRVSAEAFNDTILKTIDPEDLLFDDALVADLKRRTSEAGLPLDDIESDTAFYKTAAVFRDNFKDLKNYLDNTGKRVLVKIIYNDGLTNERALLLRRFFMDSLKIPKQDIILMQENEDYKSDSTKSAKVDSVRELLKMADKALVLEDGFWTFYGDPVERMEPPEIIFRITDIRRQKVAKWRIVITDFIGNKIHEICGYHKVEPEVPWDGFASDGTLFRFGNFLYYFQYSMDGRRWVPKRPKRHRITFRYIKRQKILEIRTKEIRDFDLLKDIVVKLKNPSEVRKRLNQ